MPDLLESQITHLCLEHLPGRTDLLTEDNQPVRIVYPGRPNDGRGADLRDAVIATAGGLVTGDIEVHVRSSGWRAHGHHEDPVYNRVVLHVVYWHDADRAVILQNGCRIPTLALERFVAAPHLSHKPASRPRGWQAPCGEAGHRLGAGRLGDVLDRAGDERFLAGAAGFGAMASDSEAGQALYRGILRALGYARNKHAMVELACHLPLRALEAALKPSLPDEEWLALCQALLMGTAGLLPSPRLVPEPGNKVSGWAEELGRLWRTHGGMAAMSGDEWDSFKVRPGNRPVRRLGAMAYLLLRYRRQGLLVGLMDYLDGWQPESPGGLEAGLTVGAEGYWAAELDFGLPAGRSAPALLGRDRAGDIVVNVLLPFAAAWGNASSRPALAAKAQALYMTCPRLAENTLERHMRRQMGIDSRLVDSARRQQGLIHIFKTRCSRGGCGECELRVEG
jgi:hypothetical protein